MRSSLAAAYHSPIRKSKFRLCRNRRDKKPAWRRFAMAKNSTSRFIVRAVTRRASTRSEEHTSELQSRQYLVCRLLLEKKNNIKKCFERFSIFRDYRSLE